MITAAFAFLAAGVLMVLIMAVAAIAQTMVGKSVVGEPGFGACLVVAFGIPYILADIEKGFLSYLLGSLFALSIAVFAHWCRLEMQASPTRRFS